MVLKKDKNHLILSKKRYIGYANPAKGNSMCQREKKTNKQKNTATYGNIICANAGSRQMADADLRKNRKHVLRVPKRRLA